MLAERACEEASLRHRRIKPLGSRRRKGARLLFARCTHLHTRPTTTPLAIVRTAVARWPSAHLSQTDAMTARGQGPHPLRAQTAPTNPTGPGPKEPMDQPARVAWPGREGEARHSHGGKGVEAQNMFVAMQASSKCERLPFGPRQEWSRRCRCPAERPDAAHRAPPVPCLWGQAPENSMVERTWRCERRWVPVYHSGRGAAAEAKWWSHHSIEWPEAACMAPEARFSSPPELQASVDRIQFVLKRKVPRHQCVQPWSRAKGKS